MKSFIPSDLAQDALAVGRNFKWHIVHERKAKIEKDIEETILSLKPYYQFLREFV